MPEFPVRPDGQDNIKLIKLSQVSPNEHNPRTISEEDFKKLKDSIKKSPEMLWTRPIVIWREENIVIMGNMRYHACKALGYDEAPMAFVSLSKTDAQRWMMIDNNSFGQWQETMLAEQLYALISEGEEITGLGFSESFLDGLGVLSDDALAKQSEEELRGNYYQVVITFEDVDAAYALARSLNIDGYQSVDVLVKTPRKSNKQERKTKAHA